MQTALRMETTVLPGHRLEVTVRKLPEGAKVEVIVVLHEQPKPHRISMLEFVESCHRVRVLSRRGKSTNSTCARRKRRGNADPSGVRLGSISPVFSELRPG